MNCIYFQLLLGVFAAHFTPTHSTVDLSGSALQCSSACAPPASLLDQNSTCLLVTLVDQFGDGWANDTALRYWAEVGGAASKVVRAAPDCECLC